MRNLSSFAMCSVFGAIWLSGACLAAERTPAPETLAPCTYDGKSFVVAMGPTGQWVFDIKEGIDQIARGSDRIEYTASLGLPHGGIVKHVWKSECSVRLAGIGNGADIPVTITWLLRQNE
jgi:hypothetical protein